MVIYLGVIAWLEGEGGKKASDSTLNNNNQKRKDQKVNE